jgi:hypothetical protein
VQVLLIGVVFYYLGRNIRGGWPEISGRDWQFNIPWLILSVVFLGGLFFGHAGCWLAILWRFKHPVPILPGIYVWFKSLLARYVPGNVLMVLGRVVMIEPYGVPKRISFTSVAYEQALVAASAATAIAIALPFLERLRDVSSLIWLVLIVPPLAIVGLHPLVLGRIGNWVFRKLKRETIEQFLPFRDITWIFGLYVISWLVAGMGLFSMMRAITEVDIADLPLVLVSAPLAWLASVLVFISPSGLGVRELVYSRLLISAFGNDTAVASAFAIVIRFWQTLVEIMFVVVVFALVKIRHAKVKPPSTEEIEAEAAAEDGLAPPL